MFLWPLFLQLLKHMFLCFREVGASLVALEVRCNRLLWSYEATRIEAEHDHVSRFRDFSKGA